MVLEDLGCVMHEQIERVVSINAASAWSVVLVCSLEDSVGISNQKEQKITNKFGIPSSLSSALLPPSAESQYRISFKWLKGVRQ